MTLSFDVTVQSAEVAAALARARERLADLTPLMEDIGRALGNLTEDAIQAERSPFGPAWRPLTPDYVLRPRPHGRGGDASPMLQLTGGLAASITHGGDANTAWVRASKRYAAIHQFGGLPSMRPGPAAIPARPYLPIDPAGNLAPAARDMVLDLVRAYLGDL